MSISVSENFVLARLFIKKSGIRQSHWLGLVNIHLHAKNYQNIRNCLKVKRHIQVMKNLWLFIKKSGISQVLSISICMPNLIKIFLVFLKVFTIYGGDLCHMTKFIRINFHFLSPISFHMKFGFKLPSGF